MGRLGIGSANTDGDPAIWRTGPPFESKLNGFKAAAVVENAGELKLVRWLRAI